MKKIVFIFFLFLASLMVAKDSSVAFQEPLSPIIQKADTAKVTTLDINEIVKSEAQKEVKKEVKATKDKIVKNLTPPPIWEFFSAGKIIWALIFIIIGYLLIRFVVSLLEKYAEKFTNQRITIKGIIPIIKIFGWIFIIVLIIVGIFQPPLATLIAVSASLGIAVGFASQDIIKNIFGGVIILLDRPFTVGDKIEVGSHYGEVVEIGLRSIRIVTADDSLVSIPNGELMNQSVSNANTGEANCQVVAEIYLPITVDTKLVRQIANESAQVSKYIYLNKPISVLFFNEVKEGRSYLKMRLKAYVVDIRYEFAFKSDMTEIVMKQLLEQKIMDPKDLR
ncbi:MULTISPECIES: mechanosensitive ion channel family protein [unclassified Polaribacter]|uniref:mechanosensitive ion channel family protein n=1 Tax=unclassified Polaribacter TaxID=196858 RepID=UPI0011BD4CCD|nr:MULTISPECIES: mechanosensitive ion channel family protein [unclassified Polaribacter]TXD54216.1 mechanosensitive ion channel family protein [Polaribacter sp. IC063]TXD62481.1 mechanosensitive ion channel family protein [Polaribacter sp. IC066]